MVQGSIRKAVKKDIPDILNLLEQVDMVHHRGRPDLFKGLQPNTTPLSWKTSYQILRPRS